jgi:hypothetical protein
MIDAFTIHFILEYFVTAANGDEKLKSDRVLCKS